MSVKITWRGEQFKAIVRRATSNGLRRTAVVFHSDCRRAVNLSNQRGRAPSTEGQPPRKRTGFGQQNIVWEHNDNAKQPAVRVGVTKNARYMFALELGTKPHIIRPKHAKILRIPWLGKGNPSKEEIKRIGLRKMAADGKGNRWFYFRKQVKHPGTRPRPWLLSTFRKNKAKYARLALTG